MLSQTAVNLYMFSGKMCEKSSLGRIKTATWNM